MEWYRLKKTYNNTFVYVYDINTINYTLMPSDKWLLLCSRSLVSNNR